MAKLRVMQVLSSTEFGGTTAMVMNIYRNIDRSYLQFDFITHDQRDHDYDEEMQDLGARIFSLPLLSKIGIYPFVKEIEKTLVANGPYAAVHSHTDFQSGYSAWAAKLANINNRICHAHSNFDDSRAIQKLKVALGRAVIKSYATDKYACSEKAASSIFGPSTVKNNGFNLFNNGIDTSHYKNVTRDIRQEWKREYGITEKTLVVGHVGRFDPIKNHDFMMDICQLAKEQKKNIVFMMVGNGIAWEEVKEKVMRRNLQKQIIFPGSKANIPEYMAGFDVLLLPSFCETLGLVCIEAQAAGTPCIVSNGVPANADLNMNLFKRMALEEGCQKWLDMIIYFASKQRLNWQERSEFIKKSGYDAKVNAQILLKKYTERL